MIRSAHIFCRVVDHYGDAGVCWRLARQLVAEHAMQVTLFVDRRETLARLVPKVAPAADESIVDGVRVWPFGRPPAELPDIVVEAFGCGLPDAYMHAMVDASRKPCWVNLEYLSAESWVEGVHGLPSPQPRLPLTRHFFMPGFSRDSGGLLRERGLVDSRMQWQRSGAASTWWSRHSDCPPPPDALVASLFCYPHARLALLLDAWSRSDRRIHCIVPEGIASHALQSWLAGPVPEAGRCVTRGALTLASWPFLPQPEYDRLLWSCDFNIVRGEDSFVRAQWAARPFAWHIYPQQDDAHLPKLDAFLDRYTEGFAHAESLRGFFHALNAQEADCASHWSAIAPRLPDWQTHAEAWCRRLASGTDLATALHDFCAKRL